MQCYAEPSERDEEESIVDRNGNDLGKEIVCVCVSERDRERDITILIL